MEQFPVLRRYESELGYRLNAEAVSRLALFRDLLLEWSQRFNLTRVTDPAEIETRLFLDSLAMIRLVQRSAYRHEAGAGLIRLVDVGAGAGFPGIPLKIVEPGIELVLIEATAKKVGFLREVVHALGLAGTEAIHGRAEELAHNGQYRAAFDVVTARAVARLPALIEICMSFCRVGGRGIFPKGREIEEEIAQAAHAARLMRCKILGAETLSIPELGGTSYVVVQQTATPATQYPRRPGIPVKDPL